MGYQTETELEKQFIGWLNQVGYESVNVSDMEDLHNNFRTQFHLLNKDKLDKPLSDKEWERVLILCGGKTVFQCAKILRDKFVLERDDGSKVYLSFLDTDFSKNKFQVANQIRVKEARNNRYDVTILINGLPLIQIELKRRGIDLNEAINQVIRYKKESYRDILNFIQFFIVSNGVDTKYFANSDKEIRRSLAFFWTDENNERLTALEDFTNSFLQPSHVFSMLTSYTIINDTDKILMVMRPYQVYAVKALIDKATNSDENAYVWHTTGSGKTLTSFKTAQILATMPAIKKVIFLVDRKDLDSQTTEEFNKFETGSVDTTDSTSVLVKQMKNKKQRLIVSTIQKMANAVKLANYAKVMDTYKDDKVVFIIDECHRSQFGQMHKSLVRHFSKAQLFGFTGTPRFAENGKVAGENLMTTDQLFGSCVHKYLINNAIHDNNVLAFKVEYINTMKGNFDWDDPTLVEAIDTDELYYSNERLEQIANHIVRIHNAKTRNKQYVSIFAVSSIKVLIKYYDIFKKIDHNLNITGIFSYGQNEDAEAHDESSRDALERLISDYNQKYETEYSTDTFDAFRRDVSMRLKGKDDKSRIDILLVVNMFLTGFDSKILSTLYLDKNLRYHDLLQAYSRTNRVEKDTKPFGQIVNFLNLKQNTDDAIRLFSGGKDASSVLIPEFGFFVEKFNKIAKRLKQIAPTPKAIDGMQSEDEQREFVEIFRDQTRCLQTLKSFIEFSFEPGALALEEQEYEDYRSKYLMLYAKQQKNRLKDSVLNDVDFCIELMDVNDINVAYILDLIQNIDLSDEKKKESEVKKIKEFLNKNTLPGLERKVKLLSDFLDRIISGLTRSDDLNESFMLFVREEQEVAINEIAKKEDIDPQKLRCIVDEYESFGKVNDNEIPDAFNQDLNYLSKRKLVHRVKDFVSDIAFFM